MRQRRIVLVDAIRVVEHGAASPEASPAGADPRTRYTGVVGGRHITVIVATAPTRRTIITVF